MKIEDRIENSLKEIDMLLQQKVTVYFVNLIGDKILINNNGLPSLVLQKKDLNNTVIQNKLEYLLGTNIKNLKSINNVEDNNRYYSFEFEEENVLSSYFYQNIYEITNTDFLKLIKDIYD